MNQDKPIECINVKTNEVECVEGKYPVVGINSLGPCIGLLIYVEKYKIAIVAHISDTIMWETTIKNNINFLLEQYKVKNDSLKYLIITGYYENKNLLDEIRKYITEELPKAKNFNQEKIPKNAIKTVLLNNGLGAREFAFNASTGGFETGEINFIDSNQINNKRHK